MAEPDAGLPLQPIIPAPPSVAPSANTVAPQTQPARGRTPPKKKTAAPPAEPKDGVREIVETVVFVVVLVLLLKSFVAEAFVIPTGSMAETLYGYQKIVTCPKCGYNFPVNCSSEVDPQQGPSIPVVGCTCPNCRYAIDFKTENMHPSPNTGDRVLVAKFLYDLNVLNMDMPKRFDVVVFKYPENPQKDFVAMNYIKRLVGLPRETIAIYYGKLYVNEGLDFGTEDRDVPAKDLWQKKYMHENDAQARDLFYKGKFRILRKPPAQMLAERRLVYDNKHQAKDLIGKVPPRWAPEPDLGAWTMDDAKEPRRFSHSASVGNDVDWLRYRHYLPEADRSHHRVELITDFMGYNTYVPERTHSSPNWVGDLMLECDVEVGESVGQLVLELSKGIDRFRARWDLASGVCTLVRITNGREEKLESRDTPLKKPGKYTLRFANVDERLTLWVGSTLPFGDGWAYEAPIQRGPTEQNDLQPASIGISGNANISLSNLKLWRDTYYTTNIDQFRPDALRTVDFGNPADWDPLRNLEPRTMYVQPNHFLCLGDNSPESSDGRAWGLVPHRLLLGRALMIYYPFWPSNRAGPIH